MRFSAEWFAIFFSLRMLSRGSTRSRLCPLLRKDEKTGERKKLVMPGRICSPLGGVSEVEIRSRELPTHCLDNHSHNGACGAIAIL